MMVHLSAGLGGESARLVHLVSIVGRAVTVQVMSRVVVSGQGVYPALRDAVMAPVSLLEAPSPRCPACVWAWLLTPVALDPDDGATGPIPRRDRDAFPIAPDPRFCCVPSSPRRHSSARRTPGLAPCLVGVVET